MPLYMDIHRDVDASLDDMAKAHASDLEAQEKHGVKYIKYWFNPRSRIVCCLVEGPNKEACDAVHREAHGLVADKIIDVESNILEAFLGGDEPSDIGAAVWPDGSLDGGLRTILFTDMIESTSTTQRLGDEGGMRLLRSHDTIVRDALSNSGGREVKHTGDGIMASFASAARAVECAVAIQRALAAHNERNPEQPIRVRIGMSAGEPVAEHKDLFGAAVQLARRVCDYADTDAILVSSVVRDLCIGKPFGFRDRGEAAFKGFADPVRVHEVQWGPEPATAE
ncbi:hypothetical protein BH18GEM1_BH18GEM1_21510 [soil metagenome]